MILQDQTDTKNAIQLTAKDFTDGIMDELLHCKLKIATQEHNRLHCYLKLTDAS